MCRPRPDAGDRHRHRAPRRRRRPGRRAARGDHAASLPPFFDNVTIGGGPAPARAYIEELLPDILEGRIEPGRVLDRTIDLDGYRAMADREALKVMIKP